MLNSGLSGNSAPAEAWAITNGYAEMASDTELDDGVSLRAHLSLGYAEVEGQIGFRKRLL